MAEHLPECLQIVSMKSGPCICWLVRACEARVTAPSHYWDLGYAAGVQAARDAVEAWFVANRDEMTWPDALAAIDALMN